MKMFVTVWVHFPLFSFTERFVAINDISVALFFKSAENSLWSSIFKQTRTWFGVVRKWRLNKLRNCSKSPDTERVAAECCYMEDQRKTWRTTQNVSK